jgi:dTDP-4-dehydrorhamnose reductase
MKILIFGGGGMLGHKLVQVLKKNFEVWTTIRSSFEKYEKFNFFEKNKTIENVNVTNAGDIEKIIEAIKPEIIINAVGIIKQLPSSKDLISTLSVNSIFPHQLAEFSKKNKAYLLNISTDCVFSGLKGSYAEDDISDAFDLYGKSKSLGEVLDNNCLTIRTSIIGRELLTQHSLVEWFLNNREKKVKGYVNARFSGFPTIILAGIIADIITKENRLKGLFHVSSEAIDKFTLLNLIKEKFNVDVEIEPFEDYKIDRSLNSDKFKKATGFKPLGWKQMIDKMAEDSMLFRGYK